MTRTFPDCSILSVRGAGICCVCCYLMMLFAIQTAWAGDKRRNAGSEVPIQVEITTHLGDGQRFMEGDTISFFLNLDRDAHVVVIYEDAERQPIQIIPNANREDNFYPAGGFIPLPGENSGFRFRVTPPFGRETLWVFASLAPIPELSGAVLDNKLKRLDGDMANIKNQIKAGAGPSFGSAHLSIITEAGN